VWEGNTLEIDIHKKRDERAPADTENFTNLYVQGLSASIDQKKLEATFSTFG